MICFFALFLFFFGEVGWHAWLLPCSVYVYGKVPYLHNRSFRYDVGLDIYLHGKMRVYTRVRLVRLAFAKESCS